LLTVGGILFNVFAKKTKMTTRFGKLLEMLLGFVSNRSTPSFTTLLPNYLVKQAGFLIPTGWTEPAGSGSLGNRKKPDKFEFQTKSLVQAVGTGIPTGLTDILDPFPVV
jgi:hypothetical protein